MIGREIESKAYRDMSIEYIIGQVGQGQVVHFKGSDWFYVDLYSHDLKTCFLRHRKDNHHEELTIKRRTSDFSIVDREEINISVLPGQSRKVIDSFIKSMGWMYVYSLYKQGSFLILPEVIISTYYVISGKITRYVEVEANPDYSEDLQENIDIVAKYEKLLGISEYERINASLAELHAP